VYAAAIATAISISSEAAAGAAAGIRTGAGSSFSGKYLRITDDIILIISTIMVRNAKTTDIPIINKINPSVIITVSR
jgi:hypothetical protein